MNSMTGYGKAVAEKDGKKITLELKSVNHRFLDLSLKLPKNFTFAEDVIRKTLSENFSRGHIDVYLNYENVRGEAVKLNVNQTLADEYVFLAKKLAESYGIENDFSVTTLFRTQDVITPQVVEDDRQELISLVKEAAEGASAGLKAMRAAEGVSIKADLKEKLENVERYLAEITERAPTAAASYREKLTARIKEVLNGVMIDEAKLINEVAFYSDKVAVDEETTRLTAHIANTRGIIEIDEPAGRKLDFIVQEFNREANTIGSKCNDLNITTLVLSLKNEIEKLREQVQNIE